MRRTPILCFIGMVGLAAPALAEPVQTTDPQQQLPPHAAMVPVELTAPPPTLVNSHTLFLNNCRPNGCVITRDNADDSRTNHSQIAPHSGTLSALSAAVDFNSIEACVKTALSPFNITVTDVDPGNVPHFEMIIAGKPTELGFDAGFEGVAPYLCGGAPGQCIGTYIPNAITFAFANTYGVPPNGTATLMCGVALQETAHGWTLDHATGATDPMTYKNYVTPLSYRDNAPCGSDCLYGASMNQNAFGVQCAGTGTNGTHVCMENNAATQNEVTIISNLFGPAGAAPPTVAITSPSTGSGEQIGMAFTVNATCTSADGIKEIDFLVDDVEDGTKTASPASFAAPNNLTAGMHHIQVICGTTKQATASAAIDVVLGNTCKTDPDCGGNGQICYQMACIAGPGAAGGLGAACTNNGDCKSGQCGNDGSQSLCVIPCDPNNPACPDGFSCLDNGAGGGVCFLGGSGSSGCCETGHGTDSRGSIVFGIGFAAVWITRSRSRKSASKLNA